MESNAFWIDKRTCKDAIPLAWTSDMLEVLGGGPIILFASLDLAFGYWQTHVKVDDGLECLLY